MAVKKPQQNSLHTTSIFIKPRAPVSHTPIKLYTIMFFPWLLYWFFQNRFFRPAVSACPWFSFPCTFSILIKLPDYFTRALAPYKRVGIFSFQTRVPVLSIISPSSWTLKKLNFYVLSRPRHSIYRNIMRAYAFTRRALLFFINF